MAEGHIGKYQIVEELGRGAMGVVYKAVDPVIGRTVAVKTIRFDILSNPQQREEAQKRFLREAQSAGNLSHPNIVTIYDVGEDQGMAYIAMEFVEGQSLEQILCAQKPWDPVAAVTLMIQIAEGLDSAHRKGIVHRDIKPANILIDRDGRPKIVDFGIARISSSHLTQTSMVMGTPYYMSPEQVAGKKVDQRADIFSLGAVFYEILTFQKPFNGDTLTTVIYKIINETPAPLPQVVPTISPALDAIVQKAISKDAETRYSSCRDLVNDLRAYAASSGLALESVAPTVIVAATELQAAAKKKTTVEPAATMEKPASGRKPVTLALAAIAVLIVVIGAVLILTKKGPGPVVAEKEKTETPAKTGESKEARLVQDAKPVYPDNARAARIQGDVRMRLQIGADGTVKNAEVLSGPPELGPAAAASVRQWVYEPRLIDGSPAESTIEATVTFTLPAETPPPGTKPEPTSTEPPKTNLPKPEPPKKEAPRKEQPKTEPPKVEPAKPEPAKKETPALEPDRAPRVLKKVDPVYPDLARQARIEGVVDVEVRVGETGRIERAAVVKGVNLLDEAALKAVRQWVFEPAIKNGIPVPMTVTYSFTFGLGKDKPASVQVPPSETKPQAKPLPSTVPATTPAPPAGKKPTPASGAPAGYAAELARATEAMGRKQYREAAAAARGALTANPSSAEAQAILTNALIQIAPGEVKSLIDQYVLSLKSKQAVEFYRLNAAPALYNRVRKDMEIVMNAYDEIQASASAINLELRDMQYPSYRCRASFTNLVTGISRQKGSREILFNGRYAWRMERRGDDWVITEITFEKAN